MDLFPDSEFQFFSSVEMTMWCVLFCFVVLGGYFVVNHVFFS